MPYNVSNDKESLMIDGITALGLYQINYVKNLNDRLLDLIYATTSLDCSIASTNNPIVNEDRHHPTLLLSFSFHLDVKFPNENVYIFDFKNANYDAINATLADFNCDLLRDSLNIDVAISIFYNLLFDCFNKFVPIKYSFTKIVNHPWYDNDLRNLRNRRNKSWKLYCNSKSDEHLLIYNELSTQFNDYLANSYNSYTNLKLKRT